MTWKKLSYSQKGSIIGFGIGFIIFLMIMFFFKFQASLIEFLPLSTYRIMTQIYQSTITLNRNYGTFGNPLMAGLIFLIIAWIIGSIVGKIIDKRKSA